MCAANAIRDMPRLSRTAYSENPQLSVKYWTCLVHSLFSAVGQQAGYGTPGIGW